MRATWPLHVEAREVKLEPNLRRFVARAGPTTRVTRLRSGEFVSFTRGALEGMVDQVRSSFIPANVEHLSYLPPWGRVSNATVETAEDGHAELYLHQVELPQGGTSDLTLRDELEDLDLWQDAPSTRPSIGIDSRNFEPGTWRELTGSSAVPLKDTPRWSSLSPLIWTLTIPVTWGLVKFAGAFFERLGGGAADGLVSWISQAAKRTKMPDRESLIEIRFETDAGMVVSGFVPFDAGSDKAIETLRNSLNRLGSLAQYAGAVAAGQAQDLQLAAFIYEDAAWRLAWWAAPDHVYIAPWFVKNCPDPSRFLGRPLFDIQGSEQGEERDPPSTVHTKQEE